MSHASSVPSGESPTTPRCTLSCPSKALLGGVTAIALVAIVWSIWSFAGGGPEFMTQSFNAVGKGNWAILAVGVVGGVASVATFMLVPSKKVESQEPKKSVEQKEPVQKKSIIQKKTPEQKLQEWRNKIANDVVRFGEHKIVPGRRASEITGNDSYVGLLIERAMRRFDPEKQLEALLTEKTVPSYEKLELGSTAQDHCISGALTHSISVLQDKISDENISRFLGSCSLIVRKLVFQEATSILGNYFAEIKKVADGVFIGSVHEAANKVSLDMNKIQYVINLAGDDQMSPDRSDVARNFHLGKMAYFCPDPEKPLCLEKIVKEIQRARKEGKNVLIHDFDGQSYAAIAAIAYIMRESGKNLETAKEGFLKVRGIGLISRLQPNQEAMDLLQAWSEKSS